MNNGLNSINNRKKKNIMPESFQFLIKKNLSEDEYKSFKEWFNLNDPNYIYNFFNSILVNKCIQKKIFLIRE